MTPLVSVILPAYNAEPYIGPAIRSILDQTLHEIELIVIDDGSTDNTLDVVSTFSSDSRVRIISQANTGLSSALNTGLSAARAEFIARMDADDLSERDRLFIQYQFLLANPEVCLVGSQITRIVGDGQFPIGETSFPVDHKNIVKGLRQGAHVMTHASIMFTARASRSVGGYWEYGVAEDWDFFLRMSEVGMIANIDLPLYRVRFHNSGINATSLQNVRTNIMFAIRRQDCRRAGRAVMDLSTFLDNMSFGDRYRIYAQTKSLTSYRRAISLSEVENATARVRRIWCLLVAAIYWPAQARRRLLQAYRRKFS